MGFILFFVSFWAAFAAWQTIIFSLRPALRFCGGVLQALARAINSIDSLASFVAYWFELAQMDLEHDTMNCDNTHTDT